MPNISQLEISRRRVFPLLGAAMAGLLFVSPSKAEDAEQPERIVAIGGAVTETLYALGAEDRIVGVDTTAVYPSEARDKPNVGYMRQLSAEGVLALSPDLILMEEGAGPPPAIELLKASGLSLTTVPGGHGRAEIGQKIRTIAGAVGQKEKGDALATEIESNLARLDTQLESVETPRKVLFILSMVDGRPMAAGTDTAADEMIGLAGGTNVFGEISGYKTLSSEAATELAPDVIVMVTGAGPDHGAADPFSIPALKATPAGQTNSLIRMDAAYLLGFGPRTADAARDLSTRLYPDHMPSPE
ncbi:ABC transporter substrate-binding protein [Fulvimarina sp. MAC8]|uniref:heme/hemin ABC transporter substrate-binding protein n=1 Tax=Fulvimarina sp. MAC8 TaxID=3162874 RepID=UPI0032EFCC3D